MIGLRDFSEPAGGDEETYKAQVRWQEMPSRVEGFQQAPEEECHARRKQGRSSVFQTRHDLSILISGYFPSIKNADVFAHEYPIYGDFRADLVVGDSSTHNYLLVEFEDGRANSIFKKRKGGKARRIGLLASREHFRSS